MPLFSVTIADIMPKLGSVAQARADLGPEERENILAICCGRQYGDPIEDPESRPSHGHEEFVPASELAREEVQAMSAVCAFFAGAKETHGAYLLAGAPTDC